MEVDDMIYMGIKVERQFKKKGHVRLAFNSGSLSPWKLNLRGEGATHQNLLSLPKLNHLKLRLKPL
jgi:hypothetical protein